MDMFKEGDVVSLRYDGQECVVVKIVEIEPLTLHDTLHLVLYDRLLEAGPRGYDHSGELRERTHEVPDDLTESPHFIDAIAMTSTAFEASEPELLISEEVTDSERTGYAIWVAQRREAAERRGMIRYDIDGEEDEEIYDDEELSAEEIDENEDSARELEEEIETVTVEIQPWHSRIYDIPMQDVLREHEDILTAGAFGESQLGRSIRERREARKAEIGPLIERLVTEGDYSAGQELLDFGDDAVDALSTALSSVSEVQQIEDICQILADIGTESSYEVIGAETERVFTKLQAEESSRSVIRAFLYAVMLTGGTPAPLKKRLELISGIDHPDLKEDVLSAIAAVEEGGGDVEPEVGESRSSDPFGSIM